MLCARELHQTSKGQAGHPALSEVNSLHGRARASESLYQLGGGNLRPCFPFVYQPTLPHCAITTSGPPLEIHHTLPPALRPPAPASTKPAGPCLGLGEYEKAVFLPRGQFLYLAEARVLIKQWRREHNPLRGPSTNRQHEGREQIQPGRGVEPPTGGLRIPSPLSYPVPTCAAR